MPVTLSLLPSSVHKTKKKQGEGKTEGQEQKSIYLGLMYERFKNRQAVCGSAHFNPSTLETETGSSL